MLYKLTMTIVYYYNDFVKVYKTTPMFIGVVFEVETYIFKSSTIEVSGLALRPLDCCG